MKSDLHEIFSLLKDWSLELIKSVRTGRGNVHATLGKKQTLTFQVNEVGSL